MRFVNLTLKNFRNYENQTFTFNGQRIWILGDLAKGKSTIFDAMRLLLTGVCRGTDRAGKGLGRLARLGGDNTFEITGTIEHNGEQIIAVRSFDGESGRFQVKGWKGERRDHERALYEWLGVPGSALPAVLDSEVFFDLGHAEAKALVMALLNASVYVPSTDETITLAQCDARYDEAFKARTDANRALKMMNLGPVPAPLTGGSIEDNKEKLAGLREQLKAAIAQRGEAKGTKDSNARVRKALEGELETARARVTAHGETNTMGARGMAEAIERAEASLKEKLNALALPPAGGVTYGALVQQAATLKNFKPSGGCVLGGGVACPVKAKDFTVAADKVYAQAEALKDAADNLAAEQAAIGKLRTEIEQARAELKAIEDHADEAERLRTKVAQIENELSELDGEEDEAAGAPTELDTTIATLEDRIAKGDALILSKIRLKAEHEAFERRKSERERIENDVKELDAKVLMYGPNGLRVKALQDAKGKFESAVNGALEAFGYSMSLSVDPWTLVINNRPWIMLSVSEKLRVSIALQAAMAVAFGLNFLLLDQIELLGMTERRILGDVLANTPLQQAIMARFFEPSAETPSGAAVKEGTQIIRLT